MLRHRLASVAVAASLGLLQGCNGCGMGIGNGQLMSRLGIGTRCPCECSTVSSGRVIEGGPGPACEGPLLEPPGATTLPPYGIGGEPPIAPIPRPYTPPLAQPVPTGPVSKVRIVDPGQK